MVWNPNFWTVKAAANEVSGEKCFFESSDQGFKKERIESIKSKISGLSVFQVHGCPGMLISVAQICSTVSCEMHAFHKKKSR